MSSYERYALILDSEEGALGRPAVGLLELGIDVLYANDLDEAALLGRQECRRLGAVLCPADAPLDLHRGVVTRVCSHLEDGPAALLLVGGQLEREHREALRELGVRWRIEAGCSERELRFVVDAMLASGHSGERRKVVRVPADLSSTVFMGRHRQDVVAQALSAGGGWFASPHPFLKGSRLHVDLRVEGKAIAVKGEVVAARTADTERRDDLGTGMGVAFTHVDEESAEALKAFVARWVARHRL